MGYRITYGRDAVKTDLLPDRRRFVLRKLASAVLACTVIIAALSFKSVRHFLLPGDPVVTEKAFKALIADLRAGEKVSDVVTAFCEEILDNA